jgi:Fe(3+) dicitrate transport protein
MVWVWALLAAQDTKPAEKKQDPAAEVLIIGEKESLERIPGSGEILDKEVIERSKPRDINEVLRKIPGVSMRDEEGFGLRPNIGVRGLNPTRSSKVLLLEDGVPIVIGPYGDNTSYYHPPIQRFERVEVLKGAGQILYGPQTVGAVFNYITRRPPSAPGGQVTLAAGTLGYREAHATLGGTWDKFGSAVDVIHKEGQGRAGNIHNRIDDLNFRAEADLGNGSSVMFKLNYLDEHSNVTYAGLTQREYEEDPRQNPFEHDTMDLLRLGGHVAFRHALSDQASITTNFYGYKVDRDWWRQWHDGVNTNQIPAADDTTDPETRVTGRVREYWVWGIEPRLRVDHNLLGLASETEAGVRAHYEEQYRLAFDGPNIPGGEEARTGTLSENNRRYADAYAAFIHNRFLLSEQWTVSAGLRVEHVRFERENELANGGLGVAGNDQLTELIPGLGLNYVPVPELTLFAGVHKGFAPPRTEDAVSNAGVPLDLDPEESWNFELGARWSPQAWFESQLTFFHDRLHLGADSGIPEHALQQRDRRLPAAGRGGSVGSRRQPAALRSRGAADARSRLLASDRLRRPPGSGLRRRAVLR